MSVDDPRHDREPFPFADLFAHGWIAGDRTCYGGEYLVACPGCGVGQKVHEVPRALPDIEHAERCPVAAYIAKPEGGAEGRERIRTIVYADSLPPRRCPS